MRSGNIKKVVTQMSLDHNIKAASALRKLTTKLAEQLDKTGTPPVVAPMEHTHKGYSISMKHQAQAVRDSTTSRRIAEAHRTLAQQLASKSSVTKMMG